ncbi:MAG: XRE family transcriptional regulator [Terracidiphilus sp.]|jgi:DNA-binding XRE family transcriptional regulator
MPVTLETILNEMSEERRADIYQRAQEIREELNLREVRRARKLTQSRLSKKLKIGQEGVSRIERRKDMNVSTLRKYVEGVGGELRIEVRFPDQPPVVLAELGTKSSAKTAKTKPRKVTKSRTGTRRAA